MVFERLSKIYKIPHFATVLPRRKFSCDLVPQANFTGGYPVFYLILLNLSPNILTVGGTLAAKHPKFGAEAAILELFPNFKKIVV